MRSRRGASAVRIAIVLAVVLAGCTPAELASNGAERQAPAPTPVEATPAPAAAGLAATASSAAVDVHAAASGEVIATLANPLPSGAPLTFLVVETRGSWLNVRLPQRPNGSTGWIIADSVTVHRLDYSLRASTLHNTLSLYRNDTLVDTFPVATGTGGTPTPTGEFFLTELLAPTNAGYGPFAFGLSAFSDVLTSFGGGVGQIGLHGTDDAASIGTAASHGCIRLSNEDITTLAEILPLGTPITIE